MDEKLKDQDVLLVREKDKDEINVVKGIDKGKLETVSPKAENHQDFCHTGKVKVPDTYKGAQLMGILILCPE